MCGASAQAASLLPEPSTLPIHFGQTVVSLGDVDGDGLGDIAVSGLTDSTLDGRPVVFPGQEAGIDGTVRYVLEPGADSFSRVLYVARAGNVNGDGFDDALVMSQDPSSGDRRVAVHLGGAAGLSPVPDVVLQGGPDGPLRGDVATGDVDGDGMAEVFVGGPAQGGGSLIAVYGGAAGGPASTPSRTIVLLGPGGPGAALAVCVDVDGDGFADLVAGDPEAGTSGKVFLFRGTADGPMAPAFQSVDGEGRTHRFGRRLVCADMDVDGYSDIVVSAPNHGLGRGRVYLFTGSATGLGSTPADFWTGEGGEQLYGEGLDAGADANGDGLPDLLIGGPGIGFGKGRAYLFLASLRGFAPSTLQTWDGLAGAQLGQSVALVHDTDGDGFDDILIGAPGEPGVDGLAILSAGAASDRDEDGILSDEDCDDLDSAIAAARAWYSDADLDGYGATDSPTYGCVAPEGAVATPGDCAGDDAAIHPGAAEVAGDAIDQDCNGGEVCFVDADEDGFRTEDTVLSMDVDCDGAGEADMAAEADCEDDRDFVFPGATEVVGNGIDEDCDGEDLKGGSTGCTCAHGGSGPSGLLALPLLLGALASRRRRP